jgi:hypothetical protein
MKNGDEPVELGRGEFGLKPAESLVQILARGLQIAFCFADLPEYASENDEWLRRAELPNGSEGRVPLLEHFPEEGVSGFISGFFKAFLKGVFVALLTTGNRIRLEVVFPFVCEQSRIVWTVRE